MNNNSFQNIIDTVTPEPIGSLPIGIPVLVETGVGYKTLHIIARINDLVVCHDNKEHPMAFDFTQLAFPLPNNIVVNGL